MPSAYTASRQIEKMAAGEAVNTWGDPKLNNVIQYLVDITSATSTISLTGDYTLQTSNTGTNDTRTHVLKFTGAGPFTVTLPAVAISFVIWNACTAALTFTTGSGDTVTVDDSDIVPIFCDGTNVKTPGFDGQKLKDYIASAVGGGPGSVVPSVTGNGGKYLTNDGSATSWANPTTSDLSDITTYTAARTALAIAFSIAL